MRIAIVLDYSLDLLGGAQRAALNGAAALVAAGHGVLLVAPRPTTTRVPLPRGVLPLWTDARRLPALDLPLLVDDAALRTHLVQRFRAEGVDAVHLHSEFGHAAAATAAARNLGLPVLHTVHTAYWPGVPALLLPAARGLLARLAGPVARASANPLLDRTLATAGLADVVLSPSAHQARDLEALGVARVTVLPNCAADEAEPVALPAGEALRVAWIGRCVPEKRLVPFVRAVRLAQRRLPPGLLRVAIAGDGLQRRAAQVAAAGVPGLAFLGRLDAGGVRALLGASHVAALTSDGFDNQPMTVVEAVRAGRGVLHVDARLTEGLQHAGLLAASPDPEGMADLLVGLALDRGRVERAAAGARLDADLFSPARWAARFEALAGLRSAVRR